MLTPPSRSHTQGKGSRAVVLSAGERSFWLARRQALIIELNALNQMLGLEAIPTRRREVREREGVGCRGKRGK